MNLFKPSHIIFLLIVVILLFGYRKLPDIARSVGQSMKVFKKEVKELRDDDIRDVVVDRPADEDDAILQETRINIVGALSSIRPLNHHGNITVHIAVHAITPYMTTSTTVKERDITSRRCPR